jgi:hypothetical protein
VIRPGILVKGILSFGSERFRNPHKDSGPGTTEIIYSRFLRFLRHHHAAVSDPPIPKVIAELGPGSSLGFGLAALIAGSQRYYAFDLVKQFSSHKNLRVFDELVALFRARTPIPNDGWCARIFPFTDDLDFPDDILSSNALSEALAPERIARLRRDLQEQTGEFIQYFAPWQDHVLDAAQKPDWIVSNSVLEHVDDLDGTYRSFGAWSKVGTVMCHSIDYSSHSLTTGWNEHWRIGEPLWTLARGKRYYFINRVPNSEHLAYLKTYGFSLLDSRKLRRVDGFAREEFVGPFRAISAADASTHLAFLVSRYDREPN